MMKKVLLTFLACAVWSSLAAGQTLTVKGDIPKEVGLSVKALAALPQHSATVKTSSGQVTYSGPFVHDVMGAVGLKLDDANRQQNAVRYVFLSASDGFNLVVSLLEFDPGVSTNESIVAITSNGKPLPPSDGFFRLIIGSDKRATRWVKLLTVMDVRRAQ